METDPISLTIRRMEAYLDQILAPLIRRLSPFHQEELRRELRAHLWERVDAYQELGMAQEDAVTEALRQFGGAEDFLQEWRREWITADRVSAWKEILGATLPALRLTMPAIFLTPALTAVAAYLAFDSPLGGPFLSMMFEVLIFGAAGLVPAAVGLAQGRKAARYSGVGMFAALSGEIAGIHLVSCMAGLLLPSHNPTVDWLDDVTLFVASFWLPIATLAATFSGRWKWRTKARHLT